MKNNYIEIFISLSLVILAVLLLNPFDLWMPEMVQMSILVGVLVFFGIFGAFFLRERAEDEREAAHRMLAGRTAFIAGSVVLVIGITVGGLAHSIDPWLVIALVAMIIGKIGARIYSDLRF